MPTFGVGVRRPCQGGCGRTIVRWSQATRYCPACGTRREAEVRKAANERAKARRKARNGDTR